MELSLLWIILILLLCMIALGTGLVGLWPFWVATRVGKLHSPFILHRCTAVFFARRPIGPCNLVLLVHHRLMDGEKSVHDSRIGAEPFVHCET